MNVSPANSGKEGERKAVKVDEPRHKKPTPSHLLSASVTTRSLAQKLFLQTLAAADDDNDDDEAEIILVTLFCPR